MVEADRADGVETAQVIFVWHVVAMPGHHIEGRMIQFTTPQLTEEFLHQRGRAGKVFVMSDRRQKIPWVGQAVAADRPEVRQAQRRAMVFGNLAASLRIKQLKAKFQAPGAKLGHASGRAKVW